jgi:hypothetical protein
MHVHVILNRVWRPKYHRDDREFKFISRWEESGPKFGEFGPVVDLADPSQVPALAEPWFLAFNAEGQIRVAMTPADLEKGGLEALGRKWS